MKLNEFFKGSIKIAVAIVISVIILFVIGWGGLKLLDMKEKVDTKKYEIIKPWLVDLQENLQITLQTRTKLVNGQMLAEVTIDGYPPYLSDPNLKARNRNANLVLLFKDIDGFKVLAKTIPIHDFSEIVNAKGLPTGLSYEFSNYIGVDDYSRISQLRVEWTLETQIPVSRASSKIVDSTDSDPCAPNLSKAERLKRLANFGTLRQISDGSYEAGSHAVTFFTYDNSLLYCR